MTKVGIVGLGLIGSSILMGLAENNSYELFSYSNSSYKKAQKYSKSSNDINILKNCDIVFVCCSYSSTQLFLNKLNAILNQNTVVVDVASIKSGLLDKKYNFNFILSHPMAGSCNSGFEAGNKDLFRGTKWLVEKENKILFDIIAFLGAKPQIIDMRNHDMLCAEISHLPAIVSFLLFDTASEDAKKIASSGFRDATRLAMTNEDMALGMIKNNEQNILKLFKILEQKLYNLKNSTDFEKIELFRKTALKRKQMYDNNGNNIL